jgi:hypothetical protein
MAIQFYSLLDFEVETKFLAGTVRAAWLRQEKGNSEGVRIELIEVPKGILRETEGTRQRAIDLSTRLDLLGLNHYALDVTSSIKGKGMKDLKAWIDFINEKSMMEFGKTLRIASEPQDQMIGQYLYQLAFIYDYDGALIELLNRRKRFSQQMVSGWYVWQGSQIFLFCEYSFQSGTVVWDRNTLFKSSRVDEILKLLQKYRAIFELQAWIDYNNPSMRMSISEVTPVAIATKIELWHSDE